MVKNLKLRKVVNPENGEEVNIESCYREVKVKLSLDKV